MALPHLVVEESVDFEVEGRNLGLARIQKHRWNGNFVAVHTVLFNQVRHVVLAHLGVVVGHFDKEVGGC